MHKLHAAGNGHISAERANMPDWISTEEAAEISGYERNYLRRVIRQGKIEAVRKGYTWWVDRASVEAYAARMQDLGNHRFDPRGLDHETSEERPG